MSIVGGYHEFTGRSHDKCGGRSLGKQLNLYGHPSVLHTPSGVLNDIPPPSVLNDIPPGVLNDIPPPPPPVYCTDIMQGDNFNLQFLSMPG